MKRRSFLAGLGGGLIAAPQLLQTAAAQSPGAAMMRERDYEAMNLDGDPVGGHLIRPEKRILFTDYRHIEAGDLAWLTPKGDALPVEGPSGEPVPARAHTGFVPYGIRLQAMKPDKEGPLDSGPPGGAMYDDGLYRAWSMDTHYPPGADLGSYSVKTPDSITISYSESKDGYVWQQKGSHTIPVKHGTGFDGACFFIDDHGKPEERYKAIFHASMPPGSPLNAELWKRYAQLHPVYRDPRIKPDKTNAMFGMTSPDGVQWKLIEKPLMTHYGDTRNTLYYDEWLGKYVLYTRLYWCRRRMVARAVSDDFYNWGPVEPVLWPPLDDPLSFDLYTNGRTSYPGLPSYHLMFPSVYRRLDQTTEVQMYSSFNGIMWNRLPGGPIVAAGDFNGFRDEYFNLSGNLLPWQKNRVALHYSGDSHPHKYPRWKGEGRGANGLVWWPQGRLSAVVADEVGEFHTFRMPVRGSQLRLNARVRRAGEIRVGLVNEQSNVPVAVENRGADQCDPIWGDSDSHPVTWNGKTDVTLPLNSKINLHFKMRRAELFGFEWV